MFLLPLCTERTVSRVSFYPPQDQIKESFFCPDSTVHVLYLSIGLKVSICWLSWISSALAITPFIMIAQYPRNFLVEKRARRRRKDWLRKEMSAYRYRCPSEPLRGQWKKMRAHGHSFCLVFFLLRDLWSIFRASATTCFGERKILESVLVTLSSPTVSATLFTAVAVLSNGSTTYRRPEKKTAAWFRRMGTVGDESLS